MKKRIGNNEIDSVRNSSKILFVFCFLFLVIVISLIFLFALYGNEYIKDVSSVNNNSTINNKKSNEKDAKEENNSISLNIDNNNIVRLFNIVRITNNTCEGYDIQDDILVNDMSIRCRFALASNIYLSSLQGNAFYSYVDEVDVKNAYEGLFGYGTYKAVETIPFNDKSLNYNANDKTYFTQDIVENDINSLVSYEKLLSAYRVEDYLYIESVSLYYEGVNKVFCSDSRCEEVLDTVVNEPSYPDYYDLYVDSKANKLNKYVYKFKLDKAGFYNYVGYEKTK